MRITILVVLITSLIFDCYSESATSISIKLFDIGSEEGQLGFREKNIGSEIKYAPRAMTIFNDEIYIVDTFNSRINVYDLFGDFRRSQKVEKSIDLMSITSIKVSERIIVLSDPFDQKLYIIDKKTGSWFSLNASDLSEKVFRTGEFFLDRNWLITIGRDNKYKIIDTDGNIVDMKKEDYLHNMFIYAPNYEVQNYYQKYVNENGLLIIGNRMSTNNFSKYRQLYELLRPILQVHDDDEFSEDYFDILDYVCTGVGNSMYWSAYNKVESREMYIIVTSQFGNVISILKNMVGDYQFSVSASGDIFHLVYTPSGIELIRSTRFSL